MLDFSDPIATRKERQWRFAKGAVLERRTGGPKVEDFSDPIATRKERQWRFAKGAVLERRIGGRKVVDFSDPNAPRKERQWRFATDRPRVAAFVSPEYTTSSVVTTPLSSKLYLTLSCRVSFLISVPHSSRRSRTMRSRAFLHGVVASSYDIGSPIGKTQNPSGKVG